MATENPTSRTITPWIALFIIIAAASLPFFYHLDNWHPTVMRYLRHLAVITTVDPSAPAVFDPTPFAWSHILRQNHHVFLQEFQQFRKNASLTNYVDVTPPDIHDANPDKQWKLAYLMLHGRPFDLSRAFPKSMEVIRQVQQYVTVTYAAISLLEPGTHLTPHHASYEPTNNYHLALLTPPEDAPGLCELYVWQDRPWYHGPGNYTMGFERGDVHVSIPDETYHPKTTIKWQAGHDYMFDNMATHEAINTTPYDRIVLILSVWRDYGYWFWGIQDGVWIPSGLTLAEWTNRAYFWFIQMDPHIDQLYAYFDWKQAWVDANGVIMPKTEQDQP